MNKGRFIFRAFSDYIYLIMGFDINLKNKEKAKRLKLNIKQKECVIEYILSFVQFMKNYIRTKQKNPIIYRGRRKLRK